MILFIVYYEFLFFQIPLMWKQFWPSSPYGRSGLLAVRAQLRSPRIIVNLIGYAMSIGMTIQWLDELKFVEEGLEFAIETPDGNPWQNQYWMSILIFSRQVDVNLPKGLRNQTHHSYTYGHLLNGLYIL